MKSMSKRIVDAYFQAIVDHPRSILGVFAFLAVVSGILLTRLTISTDRTELGGADTPHTRRYVQVVQKFGSPLTAVVVLSGNKLSSLRKAGDELARIYAENPLVREVFYKVDLGFFKNHGLLFLDIKEFAPLFNLIDQLDLNRFKSVSNMSEFVLASNTLLSEILSGKIVVPSAYEKQSIDGLKRALSELRSFARTDLRKKLDEIETQRKKLIPASLVPQNYGLDDNGYLVNNDGKLPHLLFLVVQPKVTTSGEKEMAAFTNFLRSEGREVARRHGLAVGVTGMPAIITDEMSVVFKDLVNNVGLSVVLILLLFLFSFRSVRATILVFLPLGIGLLFTTAFGVLAWKSLTLISAYFAGVLFALGIAYAIHILSRYDEASLRGLSSKDAALEALRGAGGGIFTGATTTAAAFYAIGLSDFFGFSQLGILAGTGVLLMMVTAFMVLPPALMLWRGKKTHKPLGSNYSDRILSRFIRPWAPAILIPSALLFCVGAWGFAHTHFDYDPFKLLPQSAESIVYYHRLRNRSGFASELNIATATSIDEAERKRLAFEKLGSVARVDSVSLFVPPGQKEKIAYIRKLKAARREAIHELALHFRNVLKRLRPLTPNALSDALIKTSDILDDGAEAARRIHRKEASYLFAVKEEVENLSKKIAKELDADYLMRLQKIWFNQLSVGFDLLDKNLGATPIDLDNLPESIRKRFISRTMNPRLLALYIYPKGLVGSRDFLRRFVRECRSVDPQVTGFPVTHFENGTVIKRSFVQSVFYAAALVFLLVLIGMRSFWNCLIALIPLAVGMGWTVAVMTIFGIKFNFINVVAIAIIIGSGVDFGVHLMHRYLQERSLAVALRQTGGAVLLSALTTIVGFSSLILARHSGAASLGLLLTIGIVSCVLSALMVFPAAMSLLKPNGPKND